MNLFRTSILFQGRDGKLKTCSCVFMAYSSEEFQFILVVFKIRTSKIWGFPGKKNQMILASQDPLFHMATLRLAFCNRKKL